MTRAANSADRFPGEPLLERLCSTQADVVFFPVRHHSPACALQVRAAIDTLQPAAVLIEGPSDFNPQFDELFLEHDLPIAIYSYFRSQAAHGGAYYPFCEYSPEWLALRHGKERGALVQFIDLPWSEVSHLDRSTHRYRDAELRTGDFVRVLCERMQVEDFDDLWDKLVESEWSMSLDDYLRRVHWLCFHIRLWGNSVSAADQRREAFMARCVAEARANVGGRVLVVTGGFHSGALAARLEGLPDCPGTDDSQLAASDDQERPAMDEIGIALTSYSYERLDSLAGYNAGMPSPGFYEHAFSQRQAAASYSHQPLLAKLVRELRERKQTFSTADLVAVETTAKGLAALRGREHVWRRDLVDAVSSSLVKDEVEFGCESPFISAVHTVLRGNRRGRLAAGTRLPPLVIEIRNQLTTADLDMTKGIRNVDFDLLTPPEMANSRLLHRLKILAIAGFDRVDGTDFVGRSDLRRLWERWRIRWSPEFEASCIEASRYGTSIADAAAARLNETAGELDRDAAAAAQLLVQAAQAGLETISQELVERLSETIGTEADFAGATVALRHLLFLFCHDEAFGTHRAPLVAQLVHETFHRSLWLLESLGQTSGSEKAQVQGMKTLLETFERAGGVAGIAFDREEFVAVLLRVEDDPQKSPTLRGAAAGALWTINAADEEAVLRHLRMFSSANHLGDFLAGLFALAREVVQRSPAIVLTIDRLLVEFGADDFQTSLPAMRQAFTYFTPREKHYVLSTLFESLGMKETDPLAALQVDEATATEALAFEERLFETVARYGLEANDG